MTDEAHFPGHFGTVAIVGVGLIGGSLGMALKGRRLAHRVVGIGRSRERLDKAVALGAIDVGMTDLARGVAEADVVVLCTTVGHIVETLPDVLEAIRPGAVVSDVGSTKGTIARRAAGFPSFVGGHPMAGSEQAGVEAATPLLFEEATWAVTPTGETDPGALRTVERLAREVGATTLTLTPEAHDAMLAVTRHSAVTRRRSG
jgi:prephenate dehydrogenase